MTSAAAWCLAQPGQTYVVGSAGRDAVRFTLLSAAERGQRFRCSWLHPLTGERAESAEAFSSRRALRPPWSPATSDPGAVAGPFVVQLQALNP